MQEKPPKPGDVIVRSEKPPEKNNGLVEVREEGKYACYREGTDEPLGTFTMKKGEMLGFVTEHTDEGRGRSEPVLYGVAGSEKILLPLGDKYVWKRI